MTRTKGRFPCGRVAGSMDRRQFLARAGAGMGLVALADLLNRDKLLADEPTSRPALAARHFPAKAHSIIWLFMEGAPSAVDVFDPKPDLVKWQGETMKGVGPVRTVMGNPGGLMPSPWSFKKYGQSGMDVSELFPHIAEQVDDIAFIRSMYATSPAHGPALFQMNTGSILAGHPSVGSWITYGLGSENENLPGFIVFTDYRGGPINGPPNWSNGYLPAAYQGSVSSVDSPTTSSSRRTPACSRPRSSPTRCSRISSTCAAKACSGATGITRRSTTARRGGARDTPGAWCCQRTWRTTRG